MARVGMAVAALTASTLASAQTGKAPWEEYDKRLKNAQAVSALGTDLFGDSVSLYDGGLSFDVTDVELQGNNALRVAIGRSYKVFNRKDFAPNYPFGDWELEVPNISGIFAPNWTVGASPSGERCSRNERPTEPKRDYEAEDFWHGNVLRIPGVGGGELLKPSAMLPTPSTGETFHWTTADHIRIACLPSVKNAEGEGFMAITPDGTRYWFDWMAQYSEPTLEMTGRKTFFGGELDPNPVPRRKNVLYATKVQDRFGNTVTYTYSNGWNSPAVLNEIRASDGRLITLSHAWGRIERIQAGTRTWSYGYENTSRGIASLASITQPDLKRWTIRFAAFTDAWLDYRVGSFQEPARHCYISEPALNETTEPVGTMTHPSGATGTFRVGVRKHGRSNVPLTCRNVTTTSTDAYPGASNDPNDDVSLFGFESDVYALLEKNLTGPGLAGQKWTYTYDFNPSFRLTPGATLKYPVCTPFTFDCYRPRCLSDDCAGVNVATMHLPDGSWRRYTFGNSFQYNEGKLLKVEHGEADGTVLRSETKSYDLSGQDKAYPAVLGTNMRPGDEVFATAHTRPLLSATTVQDGVSFTATNILDVFTRPVSVTHSNSLGRSRTSTTTYADRLDLWVLGNVSSEAVAGVTSSRTEFDTLARPWKIYGPGATAPDQILGYHADGTLASVTDALGRMTYLDAWKRGIPQQIRYADQNAKSATVDDDGLIRSVTDENGFATGYGYDAMGRLASIAYPTGDPVAYHPTTIRFAPSGVDAYGIPAGHWQRIEETGASRKVTFFDALWRPIVEEVVDTGDMGNTHSWTARRYDALGREAFVSYPRNLFQTGSVTWSGVTGGTYSTYDTLGRIREVRQDSEHGVLSTTTRYLPGLATVVRNPRGFETTTYYDAFEAPSYDQPKRIEQPKGITTTIQRDILGRTTDVTRSGPEG